MPFSFFSKQEQETIVEADSGSKKTTTPPILRFTTRQAFGKGSKQRTSRPYFNTRSNPSTDSSLVDLFAYDDTSLQQNWIKNVASEKNLSTPSSYFEPDGQIRFTTRRPFKQPFVQESNQESILLNGDEEGLAVGGNVMKPRFKYFFTKPGYTKQSTKRTYMPMFTPKRYFRRSTTTTHASFEYPEQSILFYDPFSVDKDVVISDKVFFTKKMKDNGRTTYPKYVHDDDGQDHRSEQYWAEFFNSKVEDNDPRRRRPSSGNQRPVTDSPYEEESDEEEKNRIWELIKLHMGKKTKKTTAKAKVEEDLGWREDYDNSRSYELQDLARSRSEERPRSTLRPRQTTRASLGELKGMVEVLETEEDEKKRIHYECKLFSLRVN